MRRLMILGLLLLWGINLSVEAGEPPSINDSGEALATVVPISNDTTVAFVLATDVQNESLEIEGPTEGEVGKFVQLKIVGLPPVDDTQSLTEALKWTKRIAMKVQQPPESQEVDFDVTLGFDLFPVLRWKLSLDLKVSVDGDYTVAFCMPGEDDTGPVLLATHLVRFGGGPTPIPDPVIDVEPNDPLSSSGPAGGPFTPPNKLYMITNKGKGSLRWLVRSSVPWIVVTPASGVLAEGKSVDVTVGFSDDVNTLVAGTYAGAVQFENLNNDNGTTPRLVVLKVSGDPPPPPPPPVQELWGIVIYQTEDLDDYGPEIARVLASNQIRTLDKRFHWSLCDKNQTDQNGNVPDDFKPWVKMQEDENLSMPHLFLVSQSGDLVQNMTLPDTIGGVISVVQKLLP